MIKFDRYGVQIIETIDGDKFAEFYSWGKVAQFISASILGLTIFWGSLIILFTL